MKLLLLNLLFISTNAHNPILLISIDGVHAYTFDLYLKQNLVSNFNEFIKTGVRAEYMIPSFPTSTWPNHNSIVTGLYPESHGILNNAMYDPLYNESVNFLGGENSLDVKWWNYTDPIWITAREEGLKTASSYWVGTNVISRSTDIWMTYDKDIWKTFTDNYDTEQRIKDVINWIYKFKIDFTTIYFPQIDSAGHQNGVNSSYLNTIAMVDNWIGLMINDLKSHNIYDNINMILTSDHGMVNMKSDCKINLFDNVNKSLIHIYKSTFGTVSQIYPIPEYEKQVYDQLKTIKNVNVYYKNETPADFHFSNNYRIGPIVVICNEGYMLTISNKSCLKGDHGFNNTLESMRTIFLARGPDFKENIQIKPFKNVDMYSLMCNILNLTRCHSNNGTLHSFHDALYYFDSNGCDKRGLKIYNIFITLWFAMMMITIKNFV